VDLPAFAAFPLVNDPAGRALLVSDLEQYAAIADAADAGLVLETATWRANPDRAATLGYDAAALDAANQAAVELVRSVVERADVPATLLSGVVGPRGDGYVAGGVREDDAAEYHAPQVASFAAAG
jgi:S-methylmethionine-dependent homocysteine/selenocysteine methylase